MRLGYHCFKVLCSELLFEHLGLLGFQGARVVSIWAWAALNLLEKAHSNAVNAL